ncbi:MAG: MFS transporter [Nitrososphaeria archaeon]|nr:MFS transporter [Conexivisphaerales archaeon]
MQPSPKRPAWFNFLIPYYAAQEIVVNIVPLYILYLGGNVIEVGYALALYNIVPIFTSILSGRLSDVTGMRRNLITISLGITLIAFLIMYFVKTIAGVIIATTLFSFGFSFAIPVIGLLLTETLPKNMWGQGNSWSFMFMLTGYIAGMIPTIIVSIKFPIFYGLYIIIMYLMLAFLFNYLYVKDPPIAFERRSEVRNFNLFLHRILKWPAMTLRAPRLSDFKILKSMKSSVALQLPVIIAASSMFFLATNLFFTSYSPYLVYNKIPYWMVLTVSTYILIVNSIGMLPKIRQRAQKADVAFIVDMLLIRVIGAISASVVASYVYGMGSFYITFLIFTILGLAYTPIYVGLSSLLYYNLPTINQGATLGVYSSFVNLSLFLGSLFSGYISYYGGYSFTFFVAGLFFMFSAIILEWFYKVHEREF